MHTYQLRKIDVNGNTSTISTINSKKSTPNIEMFSTEAIRDAVDGDFEVVANTFNKNYIIIINDEYKLGTLPVNSLGSVFAGKKVSGSVGVIMEHYSK